MTPTNVSTASALTPPAAAKDKIAGSQALIAICTRRDELKSGGYQMPQAVQDEISIAYGMNTPVLMFVEKDVKVAGFKGNLGSYLTFDRDKLTESACLLSTVEALHGIRLDVVGPSEMGSLHGMSEAHAEHIRHLVELKWTGSDFLWTYETSKKLVYSHASKRGIPSSAWCSSAAQIPKNAPNVAWGVKLDSSSRGIQLEPKIERHAPECVDALIYFKPSPEEGDFVDFSTSAESRYFNPLWLDEAPDQPAVHLNKGDYKCAEGLVFIHRTARAVLEFRFAKEYGITSEDLVPYVGSYTSTLDYEVDSELKRATVRIEQFGGHVTVRMEIESPLPGHMYGVAWNPRPRPASTGIQSDAGESAA